MASRNGNNKSEETIKKNNSFHSMIRKRFRYNPIDKTRVESADERIDTFFYLCDQYGVLPNVVSLAMALGIGKQTMYRWCDGIDGVAPSVRDSIKKAREQIEANTLTNAQNNAINPIAAALVLNNNFGYAKQDQLNIRVEQVNRPVDVIAQDYPAEAIEEHPEADF